MIKCDANYLFYNSTIGKGSKIHRITTGHIVTACGLSATKSKAIARDVTCNRCKDSSEYRHGSH